MKLSTQISEKMRDSSSIWAAPIYRRLLSADKRERDMCIRCLLKIKSLIIPSPLALSKVWWSHRLQFLGIFAFYIRSEVF